MIAYVALGGNLGDVEGIFQKALDHLKKLPEVSNLEASHFYWNPAVSPIAQPDFLNGVCRFNWGKGALELLEALQSIQFTLGQLPKPKEAPRLIDLDLLFLGDLEMRTGELELPHPRWKERLFVLNPLSDLTETIEVAGVVFDIQQLKEELYAQCAC